MTEDIFGKWLEDTSTDVKRDPPGWEITDKVCNRCKQVKPFSEFYKDTRGPHGLSYRCMTCCAEQGKALRKKKAAAKARKARKAEIASLPASPIAMVSDRRLEALFNMATNNAEAIQNIFKILEQRK
jgi:hypothetical protein